MTQTWHHVLFAHWRIDPIQLRAYVPQAFDIEAFSGSAWLGIVPFDMTDVRPRGVPPLPWVSASPELNVRTYVRVDDKPGVYFFSLDAGNPFAVMVGRLLGLRYHRAKMSVRAQADGIYYRSRRRGSVATAELEAVYGSAGEPFLARSGTLEHFLTERYCLYNTDPSGRPYRLDIHHPPWPLEPAVAVFHRNTMASWAGQSPDDGPPLLHYTRLQRMVAWLPRWLV
jgi:uncharacterized protein YqjF (DUF2071 family)